MNKQLKAYSQLDNYELREVSNLVKEINAVEKASLIDRKENKQELIKILNNNLEHFFNCLDYICNGDYGFASQYRIKNMTKRMNRRAGIFILLSAVEYKVPCKMACDIWHGLDTDLQVAINTKIDEVLKNKIDIQE